MFAQTIHLFPRTHRSLARLPSLALLLLTSQFSQLVAQTTVFTYQGRLLDHASPANGLYDLRFTVFDAPSNGNLLTDVLTSPATPITNGLFSVQLDFGGSIFTGEDRWLEIQVATNVSGVITTLVPRQMISVAPYAITARSVTGTVTVNQVTGVMPLTQLPTTVITNGSHAGGALSGSYPNPTIASMAVAGSNIVDGSVTSSKLASNALSEVQQVVRGVVDFSGTTTDVTVSFSPSVDPSKCRVKLSAPVFGNPPSGNYMKTTTALVAGLTANTITLAVDHPPSIYNIWPCRVSYEIVQSSTAQQVVRGVIPFNGNTDVSQSFSPAVNPSKCQVALSGLVYGYASGNLTKSQSAAVVALTANSITVALDYPTPSTYSMWPCRVSYEICQAP